jgi:hypothetical protein
MATGDESLQCFDLAPGLSGSQDFRANLVGAGDQLLRFFVVAKFISTERSPAKCVRPQSVDSQPVVDHDLQLLKIGASIFFMWDAKIQPLFAAGIQFLPQFDQPVVKRLERDVQRSQFRLPEVYFVGIAAEHSGRSSRRHRSRRRLVVAE